MVWSKLLPDLYLKSDLQCAQFSLYKTLSQLTDRWEKQLGSLNKSDGQDVRFLGRPWVFTVRVLVLLAVIVAIVLLIDPYFDSFVNFAIFAIDAITDM